ASWSVKRLQRRAHDSRHGRHREEACLIRTVRGRPRGGMEVAGGAGMASCKHMSQIRKVTPSAEGCEDCLKIGSTWVQLRLCLTCGHVGCCDSSPNRHATKHFQKTEHPIIRSFEPGESWRWCYVDEAEI